jgi:DNA processing protein
MTDQLLYQIGISLIYGIGAVNAKKLIAYCGSAEAVFKESKKNLMKIPGMGEKLANNILSSNVLHRAEEEIDFIVKNEITPLYFKDKDFPQRLLNCYDHPIMLYYKGNADLNKKRIISIVGTRRITSYGRNNCSAIVEGLKEKDVLVVSGLAYGVDSCAHRKALEYDITTVGVLGHGLDRLYPAQNRKLAERMLENGGLITEYISKTTPDRENFPKRNRIVAGMSDATLIIESDRRGGAMITAEMANGYNRDVFALPGNTGNKFSRGCNFLIKVNKAFLCETAEDIAYIMGWDDKKVKTKEQLELFVNLSEEEQKIVEILKENGETGIDVLVLKSGFSTSKVAAALLNLEFNGLINSLPGKRYKLI